MNRGLPVGVAALVVMLLVALGLDVDYRRRWRVWRSRRNLRRMSALRRTLGDRARQVEAAIHAGHPSATPAARRELASLVVLLVEVDELIDDLLDELSELGATP